MWRAGLGREDDEVGLYSSQCNTAASICFLAYKFLPLPSSRYTFVISRLLFRYFGGLTATCRTFITSTALYPNQGYTWASLTLSPWPRHSKHQSIPQSQDRVLKILLSLLV
jgi:hypothetical protein